MNGFGQRIFPGNIQFLNYSGYWKQGKMCGEGLLFYKSGSMYKGTLINDLKEGAGYFKFPERSIIDFYNGTFLYDKAFGNGTYAWKGGAKYVGGFRKGVRWGYGVFTMNGVILEGFWKGNQRWGNGTSSFPNGERCAGNYENGTLNGFGICFYNRISDVVKYEGNFKLDFQWGKGTIWLNDGTR
jgi:hypothetical protein